jgi:hypothetical protein
MINAMIDATIVGMATPAVLEETEVITGSGHHESRNYRLPSN